MSRYQLFRKKCLNAMNVHIIDRMKFGFSLYAVDDVLLVSICDVVAVAVATVATAVVTVVVTAANRV